MIKYKNIRLQILGEGFDQKRLKNLILELGIAQNSQMFGHVSMKTYRTLMQKADVVVNPCLKEGSVTTSLTLWPWVNH